MTIYDAASQSNGIKGFNWEL
ncbi:hypothetical protein CSPAE12_00718 [Colletotrichum incanum]|nr:hypothetical protein CSPAE12_00718 [Colletotrichum incanum]